MTNQQIWQAALGEIELSLSKANFTTWFRDTCIISNQNNEIVVGVPNAFTREWLQNKYHKHIYKALSHVTGNKVKKVRYQVLIKKVPTLARVTTLISQVKPEPKTKVKIDLETNLNPRYTFETFVVGSSNELARAAAFAVATNPGTVYNPLFIFGGVGLGKTHLIQAIGNELKKRAPDKKILYVTCEKFTEDFINFIQKEKGKTSASRFKNKYRTTDVLLIDDIQFLSGKEGTQEEFFHTFNTLYQNNKQIVLTSDRPPKAIVHLEDRLVSRFEGGMIADIGLPDLETRRAILEEKCREREIELFKEVIDYIANNIQHNIRELEGALSRIIAYCQLNDTEPTLEIVQNILANLITNPQRKAITPKKVIEVVANFYDLNIKDLVIKSRKKEVAWPRQIAMFLMRDEISTSYPSIGAELGGRDHTTAMHAYKKVSRRLEQDENLKQEVDLIRQRLYLV